jgi:hypothetical protein
MPPVLLRGRATSRDLVGEVHMVVKPKSRSTAAEPDRVSLGRVRVTIDDLDALLKLLSDVPLPPGASPLAVEYDKGEFTEATDIQQLLDEELQDLRVKCGDLTVYLSPSRAEAVGPAELGAQVENEWARDRQTRRRPALNRALFGPVTRAFAISFSMAAVAFILPATRIIQDSSLTFFLSGVLLGSAVVPLFFTNFFFKAEGSGTYAVILPYSPQEIREQKLSQSKWPIISATIAALALIASLTFNVINLMRH